MTGEPRVVFDCNVFLQALGSPNGPAGRCVELAIEGEITLFISLTGLHELRDVTSRPRVIAKLRLDPGEVVEFIAAIESTAILLKNIPKGFDYPRDPKDAQYIDPALAANASLIVSRDKDLLELMDTTIPDGRTFRDRFPKLQILNPVQFLQDIFR